MSTELKEIKQRIGSTRQIRRVTGTLQRVAAARMASDRKRIEHSRVYLDKLILLLRAVGAAAPRTKHPFTTAHGRGDVGLVVFGADRGLCGGFTSELIQEIERFTSTRPAESEQLRLVLMGKVLDRRARRAGFRVARSFRQASVAYVGADAGQARTTARKEVAEVAALVVEDFLSGKLSEVHVLYSRFVSALRQKPVVERLLPISLPADPLPSLGAASLEPAAEEILAQVLPEFLDQFIFDAFLNSLGSENAARQLAMNRATENAAELLEGLIVGYRRLRQDSITTEMLELFGGDSGEV